MTRYWWVNQNQSYEAEQREGLLWAPTKASDGSSRQHWETMTQVQPGDLIFHYANQTVKAISTVLAKAVTSPRPQSLPADLWDRDGRLVKVEYRQASRPVSRHDIPEAWKLTEPQQGPFQRDAGVKLGYLWPVSNDFGKKFMTRFGDRYPPAAGMKTGTVAQTPEPKAPVVPPAPPEALAGAGDLVRRLIGVKLHTLSGAENQILSVAQGQAMVGTGKSPEGKPVPISEVQEALDLLINTGSVIINPANVGYRSAFVGAVLRTIPGVQVDLTPGRYRLHLVPPSAEPQTDTAWNSPETVTFEGDLSIPITSEGRGEQALLRRALLGSAPTATCAICGDEYPTRFLVAAHIKKRSVCTDDERRDLSHVAMTACVFGCDALFETGYLIVNADGRIQTASIDGTSAIVQRLAT